MEFQQQQHPQVVLLGIPDDDLRHVTPMSKEVRADGKTKRSTFACITCHSMKQRCNPSYPNDIYRHPCIRCAKLNKICQFDLSKRRRKKKKGDNHNQSLNPSNLNPQIDDGDSELNTSVNVSSAGSGKDSNAEETSSTSTLSPNLNIPSYARNAATNDQSSNFSSNLLSASGSSSYPIATAVNADVITKNKHMMNNSNLLPQQTVPNGWQYQNPNLNQHQRLLPRPWLDAELKKLESAGRSPLRTPIQTEPLMPSISNDSSVLLQSKPLTTVSTDNANCNNRKNDVNITSIQNHNNNTANNGDKIIPPNLLINSGNLNKMVDDSMNNTSISTLVTKENHGNNITSNNMTSNSNFINEYELELTNLLSWQKGALEATASKLSALAVAWDEVVQTGSSVPLYTDPLALGLISQQDAEYRLKLYRETMSKKFHLPLVKIPEDITIDQLRRSQPILFSTILSVVSLILPESYHSASDNMRLDNFALSLICHYAVRIGNKNAEVIKSLLVLCLWYNFSEWNTQTRYHFFNYICCSAIRDMDLSTNSKMVVMVGAQQHLTAEKNIEHDDEFYRMVLMIYVSGLNISIFLRQPIQLRWSSKFETFCEGLWKGAYPSKVYGYEDDKLFVVFAKVNHCLELIHTHIQLTGGAMENINDYITFDMVKFIDNMKYKLDQLHPQILPSRYRLLAFFYSVYAYLYESILINYFQTKSMEEKFEMTTLPTEIEDAFKNCLEKCLASFDYFFKLTPDLIASMPLFHITRIIYVLGVLLLKLRFGAMTIPALSHFKTLTDPCIDILKDICTVLDQTSSLYPHNGFIVKLRYVCALFSQTYATNIRKYLERQNTDLDLKATNLFQSADVSSFFVDSTILENSINSLNDQFWTDMLTNLL